MRWRNKDEGENFLEEVFPLALPLSRIFEKRAKANHYFSVVLNGGIAKVQKPQIDFLRFLCYNSGMGIDDAFVIQMRNLR